MNHADNQASLAILELSPAVVPEASVVPAGRVAPGAVLAVLEARVVPAVRATTTGALRAGSC